MDHQLVLHEGRGGLAGAPGQAATFEVVAVYDADKGASKPKVVAGDAGAERTAAHGGAGGTFEVKIGGQTLPGTVKTGREVKTSLGRVNLTPGRFDIRVKAVKIEGEELLRLRSVVLTPVRATP